MPPMMKAILGFRGERRLRHWRLAKDSQELLGDFSNFAEQAVSFIMSALGSHADDIRVLSLADGCGSEAHATNYVPTSLQLLHEFARQAPAEMFVSVLGGDIWNSQARRLQRQQLPWLLPGSVDHRFVNLDNLSDFAPQIKNQWFDDPLFDAVVMRQGLCFCDEEDELNCPPTSSRSYPNYRTCCCGINGEAESLVAFLMRVAAVLDPAAESFALLHGGRIGGSAAGKIVLLQNAEKGVQRFNLLRLGPHSAAILTSPDNAEEISIVLFMQGSRADPFLAVAGADAGSAKPLQLTPQPISNSYSPADSPDGQANCFPCGVSHLPNLLGRSRGCHAIQAKEASASNLCSVFAF